MRDNTATKAWASGTILFFMGFSALSGTMEPPAIEWQKTIGGTGDDRAYAVRQTTDGGYIVTGYTNSSGAGGFDAFLAKMDSDGNVSWEETFGGTANDYGHSVEQTSDGGYIIVGETESFSVGEIDVYLVKTDSGGDSVWQKTFGGTQHNYARSVKQSSDGGYIIAGKTDSFGAEAIDVYLIKTDSSGDLSWQKTFGGAYTEGLYCVQQTFDGGYVACGWTNSFGVDIRDAYVVKTDSDGNFSWQNTFGGTGDDRTHFVQQTSDGGYVLAGAINCLGAGGGDACLIKTDSGGNLSWQKTFGGALEDYGHAVQETSDKGYILVGETEISGVGDYHVWLIKTGSGGKKEWDMTFGGVGDPSPLVSGDDDPSEPPRSDISAISVQETSDGGYIVGGWTDAFGAGGCDAYVVKIARPPTAVKTDEWILY